MCTYMQREKENKTEMLRGPETNQYHKGERRIDLKATEKTVKLTAIPVFRCNVFLRKRWPSYETLFTTKHLFTTKNKCTTKRHKIFRRCFKSHPVFQQMISTCKRMKLDASHHIKFKN